MAVTAPADKRYKRAHLKPSRKHAGWIAKRWRVFAVALAVAAGGFAARRKYFDRESRSMAAERVEFSVGGRGIAPADAALDGRRHDSGARTTGHRPHQRLAVSRRRARHGHRRLRPELRRPRPADYRRPVMDTGRHEPRSVARGARAQVDGCAACAEHVVA